MAEYIKRDMALEELNALSVDLEFDNEDDERLWNDAIAEAYSAVSELPVSDARPEIHGIWLPGANDKIMYCSLCGIALGIQNYVAFRFCPNCGANMSRKD